MSCNCKAKRDFDKISKLNDPINDVKNIKENFSIKKAFFAVASGILKILIGFLLFILFIVVSVPILLYAGVCMIIGVRPEITLINPYKFKK